jgi:hypothetical protein
VIIGVEFHLRDPQTQRFLSRLDASATSLAADLVTRYGTYAKANIAPHSRTFYLFSSIEPYMIDSRSGSVRVGAPYAGVVEEGGPPHAIPNAFGRGYQFGNWPDFHPGQSGVHYLADAYYQVAEEATAAMIAHYG